LEEIECNFLRGKCKLSNGAIFMKINQKLTEIPQKWGEDVIGGD
jgi:hypothetical protein